ncbi:MAG: response regulator [Alphaproteobacteria bacterium]|nr:response regulator [Alphaproteobacteria bacterium]
MARILIAEDDQAMRVFLDRALSRSGHEVNAVPSGETAARYAETEAFDLLLTDVDMPGLNGVDLARQLLERSPKQAVLFVTGFAAQALQATDVLASGARVLSKPFALSDLVAQVDGVLARGLVPSRRSQ